jgi:hypothetical protein
MADGSILLVQVAAKTEEIEIACKVCPRRGRLRTDRLLAEHGQEMGMPTLLRILAGDCPQLKSASISENCDVHSPTLSALFMPAARLI